MEDFQQPSHPFDSTTQSFGRPQHDASFTTPTLGALEQAGLDHFRHGEVCKQREDQALEVSGVWAANQGAIPLVLIESRQR